MRHLIFGDCLRLAEAGAMARMKEEMAAQLAAAVVPSRVARQPPEARRAARAAASPQHLFGLSLRPACQLRPDQQSSSALRTAFAQLFGKQPKLLR